MSDYMFNTFVVYLIAFLHHAKKSPSYQLNDSTVKIMAMEKFQLGHGLHRWLWSAEGLYGQIYTEQWRSLSQNRH